MPSQHSLRLDYLHRTKKARRKPGDPYEQHAITAKQSRTRRSASQSDSQLMAEKQILGLKPAPRLEQVDDDHAERAQDRKHRCE
jgi:hypothetical protein